MRNLYYSSDPELQKAYIIGYAYACGQRAAKHEKRKAMKDDAEFEAKVKRDKDGKFANSSSNTQKREVSTKKLPEIRLKSTLPTFEVQEGKSAAKSATNYMRQYYVNGVKRINNPKGLPENVSVVFSTRGAKETGTRITFNKADVLPHLKEIYQQGQYLGVGKDGLERHPNVVQFHYTGGKVKTENSTYFVTLCSMEYKNDQDIRHYFIDKADKAEDKKIGPSFSLPETNIRGLNKNPTYEKSITNNRLKTYEFFDFTVEKMK